MTISKTDLWKTILVISVVYILLPTADVVTDLILIVKLYRAHECKWSDGIIKNWWEYEKCRTFVGPDQYCSNGRERRSLCGVRNDSETKYYCLGSWILSSEYKDYEQCDGEGYDNYCTNIGNNPDICGGRPYMATAMLVPFSLNYIFCFIAFFNQEMNKKSTFIFPLLNLYPQFGRTRI